MRLHQLTITNLRNIKKAFLSFQPQFNFVSGINGSGKTSFLEAIYLLGTGHSFRTRDNTALVSHGMETLTVFAKTLSAQKISIQKSIHSPTQARIDGRTCLGSSELASFLPCLLFYQDIFELIDAGPALRRGLLDWGLFHDSTVYFSVWKDYRRVLKQRNSLLKQRAKLLDFKPWDIRLHELASQLDALRQSYFERLVIEFNSILPQLTDVYCRLQYYRGWDKKNEGKTLLDVLQGSYQRDCLRQFTHYGAHHADLFVVTDDFKIKQVLSRGQQKMVLFALKFAQARLLDKPCLYLIDDLAAELDAIHISRLMEYMTTINGQFFITTRDNDLALLSSPNRSSTVFSLQAGDFTLLCNSLGASF